MPTEHRAHFATSSCIQRIVLLLVGVLVVGCATTTHDAGDSLEGGPIATIRTSEIVVFDQTQRAYRVDEILVAPNSTISVQYSGSAASGDENAASNAMSVGATPWRWDQGPASYTPNNHGKVPVGVVVIDGEVISPATGEYWALSFFDNDPGTLKIMPQRSARTRDSPGGDSKEASLDSLSIAGGFYPLVLEGSPVAETYPGSSIRAARVVVAADQHGDVAIIAVEGNRLGKPGVTTVELSLWLTRQGYTWALNLDGGRSAYVSMPGGVELPPRVPFRRRGPIQVVFSMVR
jgi:hypothetical protein